MRDFKRRLQKLEAILMPQIVNCDGRCGGFRIGMDPTDKLTGQRFHVCSVDFPVWRTRKGTERPETLEEYEDFRIEYREERARAHQEAKRNTWRAGKQMIQDKD